MEKRGIGELISSIRMKRNISQKILCDGLCSVQTLSLIESEQRIPDVFLAEALLQRLGFSLDDLETVLFCEEYQEIQRRDSIEEKIEKGMLQEAEEELDKEYRVERDGLKGQYYYQIKAVLSSAKGEHEESLKCIQCALACTQVEFANIGNQEMLLSTKELELMCMWADEKLAVGDKAEAKEVIRGLMQYPS